MIDFAESRIAYVLQMALCPQGDIAQCDGCAEAQRWLLFGGTGFCAYHEDLMGLTEEEAS